MGVPHDLVGTDREAKEEEAARAQQACHLLNRLQVTLSHVDMWTGGHVDVWTCGHVDTWRHLLN